MDVWKKIILLEFWKGNRISIKPKFTERKIVDKRAIYDFNYKTFHNRGGIGGEYFVSEIA